MKSQWEGFMDVAIQNDPQLIISYRSANFVFEEGMRDGRWVALYYNAAGHVGSENPNPESFCVNPNHIATPESFEVVVDGQSLNSNWIYDGCDIKRSDGEILTTVKLIHELRPVRVYINTVLDGTAAIERYIEIENLKDEPAAISAVSPLSGPVQCLDYHDGWGFRELRPVYDKSIWRIGYLAGSNSQMTEGIFEWKELPCDGYSICGGYRRDRYRHPFFVLNNCLTGEYMIVQFGWSGGYKFDFNQVNDWNNPPTLILDIAIDSTSPIYVLAPHERWSTPEIHFGMVFGGLDEAINSMHHHLRKVILHKPEDRRELIVSGFGAEFKMDIDTTLSAVDYAEKVGAEVFFIDAGWYAEPGKAAAEWDNVLGDWEFNKSRYPNGIAEVRDYCHKKGLLFGVWMEPERIGNKSEAMRKHPDWVLKNLGGKQNQRGYLDLSNPECAKWVEEQIIKLIEENELDFFRLDHNITWPDYIGAHDIYGYKESSFVRNHQTMYGICKRLRKRFPRVIFESCASGGGRTDIGMVKYFHHTWVTDSQIQPNAFRITNGMTMALPPEHINRMIGGMHYYVTADIRTSLRNMMFTQLSVSGIVRNDILNNDRHMEEIRHSLDIYRSFVRPMLPNSDIYHHTPELPGFPPHGFGILELDNSDGTQGMLGVFRLSDPCENETVVRLRGIDRSYNYRVSFDNDGSSCLVSGWQLMNEGIRICLNGALTSELVLYKADKKSL